MTAEGMTGRLQQQPQLPLLHAAAYRLDATAVNELLRSGNDANEATGSSGLTACMLACLPSGADLAEDPGLWLQQAAEAEEPYDEGNMEERMAVVRSLLAAGADPCVGLQLPNNTLSSSSSSSSSGSSIQHDQGECSNHQQPMALQLAAAAGSTQLLELLIAAAGPGKPRNSCSTAAGAGPQQQSVHSSQRVEQDQDAASELQVQQQSPSKDTGAACTVSSSLGSATPASLALMADRPDALRLLLQGAWGSFNDPHVLGLPLHRAVQWRHLTCVQELLNHGADANAVDPANGCTPLHWASTEPQVPLACSTSAAVLQAQCKADMQQQPIIEALVIGGARVDCTDDTGITPLAVAVCGGQRIAMQMLISLKANVHVTDAGGNGLLEMAWDSGDWDLLRDLIQLGVRFQKGRTLPSWRELFTQPPPPQDLLYHWLAVTDTMCQAQLRGNEAAVAALGRIMNRLEVTDQDIATWAAADAAAEPTVLKQVLRSSWSVLHPRQDNVFVSRCLHEAEMFKGVWQPDARWRLLAQGLLGPVRWAGHEASWWAVHAAVACQDVDGLQLVLRLGGSATQPVPYTHTLDHLMQPGGDMAQAQLTPLCLCLPLGRQEGSASGWCTASGRAYELSWVPTMVRLLKQYGASVGELAQCNLETLEALAAAHGEGATDLLQALLEDEDGTAFTAVEEFLAAAAMQGRWQLLQQLLACHPQLSVNVVLWLASHAAAAGKCGLLELCLARLPHSVLPTFAEEILRHVLDADALQPPEKVATVVSAVSMLLQHGADVNATYADKLSPLAVAFQWRWPELVRLLIGHGADVSVINEQGLWEEAAAGADPALVEELLSAGCPLPPGGVKQLVLWLRVPANAALVEAWLAEAATAATRAPPQPDSSQNTAPPAAAGWGSHGGQGRGSEQCVTAKPLSPAEIAAAALRAEAAQRTQSAAPVADDKASKKAAKKQRQAAAKAAAAEAAAAAGGGSRGGGTAAATPTAATLSPSATGAAAPSPALIATATSPVSGAAGAAGRSTSVTGSGASDGSPAASMAGSSICDSSRASGSGVGKGPAITARAHQEGLTSAAGGTSFPAAASSSSPGAEQHAPPEQLLSQQVQSVAAGAAAPSELRVQAGPTAKPITPAEMVAAALRAEMDQQRQLTPEAAAKAAQKAAKKQRQAAAKAANVPAAAPAAPEAGTQRASSSVPGAAVGGGHSDSSSSSSSSSSSTAFVPARRQDPAGDSGSNMRERGVKLPEVPTAAVAHQAALNYVPSALPAAVSAGQGVLVVTDEARYQQGWQHQQPTLQQQQQPPQQQQQQQQQQRPTSPWDAVNASGGGGAQQQPHSLPGAAGLLLALNTARQAQLVQQQRQQQRVGYAVQASGMAEVAGVGTASGSRATYQAGSTLNAHERSSSSSSRTPDHLRAAGRHLHGMPASAGGSAAAMTAGQARPPRPPTGSPQAAQLSWAAVAAPAEQQQQQPPAQTAGPPGSVAGSTPPQTRLPAPQPAQSTGGQMRLVRPSWQKECVVCLDAPSTVLTLPCAHLTLCAPCAQLVLQRAAECPMCRTPVETQVMLPGRIVSSG